MSEKEPKKDKARSYNIDYFDAFLNLFDATGHIPGALPEGSSDVSKNIWGYADYTGDRKSNYPYKLEERYFLPQIVDEYTPRKVIGIYYAVNTASQFDLLSTESNIVIPRDTPILDLHLSGITFDPNAEEIVTPKMISSSLQLIAAYIKKHEELNPEYVIGITHPRLAEVCTRWGFAMVDHPFPPEVYALLEKAKELTFSDREKRDLERLKNESLVCMQKQQFLDQYSASKHPPGR